MKVLCKPSYDSNKNNINIFIGRTVNGKGITLHFIIVVEKIEINRLNAKDGKMQEPTVGVATTRKFRHSNHNTSVCCWMYIASEISNFIMMGTE